MDYYNLPYYHIIEISFLGCTNYLGPRIRIKSERFEQSIIIDYSHEQADIRHDAIKWLESKGFEIVGAGEIKNGFALMSVTFEPLKPVKFYGKELADKLEKK
jgi:hypothetical protein